MHTVHHWLEGFCSSASDCQANWWDHRQPESVAIAFVQVGRRSVNACIVVGGDIKTTAKRKGMPHHVPNLKCRRQDVQEIVCQSLLHLLKELKHPLVTKFYRFSSDAVKHLRREPAQRPSPWWTLCSSSAGPQYVACIPKWRCCKLLHFNLASILHSVKYFERHKLQHSLPEQSQPTWLIHGLASSNRMFFLFWIVILLSKGGFITLRVQIFKGNSR